MEPRDSRDHDVVVAAISSLPMARDLEEEELLAGEEELKMYTYPRRTMYN